MLENILICGMAIAFLVAILREFPTPSWLDEVLCAVGCVVGIYFLTGAWAPVPSVAAMFVAAFLGLLVRKISVTESLATRRQLPRRIPPL